jgi:anti-anti-sigma factor
VNREVTTIALAGEIDMDRREELDLCVALSANAAGDVRLDVHDVTFLDSSGLGAIARIAKVVHERDKRVLLAGASRRLVHVLQLARMDHLVELED